jgi:hypothetical protein
LEELSKEFNTGVAPRRPKPTVTTSVVVVDKREIYQGVGSTAIVSANERRDTNTEPGCMADSNCGAQEIPLDPSLLV